MSQQGKLRVRRESLQRIQIGLAGLAGVLLIVILSNIVINAARPDITAADDNAIQQSAIVAGAANGMASDAATPGENEPLAALGVTPKSDQAGTKPLTVAPAVPDLKPDPRLTNPMDRDPSASGRASNQAQAVRPSP